MKRARSTNPLILILVGWVILQFPLPLGAKETSNEAPALTAPEEISAYSLFIEKYVNQNWKRDNPSKYQYKVTLLEVTKRERAEELRGQYNYCWVTLELGREIHECVACFWQPDKPPSVESPFVFRGIYEVGRKLTI